MYGASHDLQQETLQLLAAKDAENFRLRQLLFESVEKFDDLNMSYVSQEAELKFANKRDVEKVQKELNMRSRDHAELTKVNLSLRKQLAGLKQQTFQNGAQIKKEGGDTHQRKYFGSQNIKPDPSLATTAPDESACTLSVASNSIKELPSTEHSKESYRCSGQSNSSISSTCSASGNIDKYPLACDNYAVKIEKMASASYSASNNTRTGIVPTDLGLNDSTAMSLIPTTSAIVDTMTTQSAASSSNSSIPPAVYTNATAAADHISPIAAAADGTQPTAAVLVNSKHGAIRLMDLLLLYQNFLMTVALLPLSDRVTSRWPCTDSTHSGNSIDNKYESHTIIRSGNGDNLIDPDISRHIQAVQQLFNSVVGEQGRQAHLITSASTSDSSADLCVVQLTSALCRLIQKLALFSLSDVDTCHPKHNNGDDKSLTQKLQIRTRKDCSKRYIQHEISNSLVRCLALLGGVVDFMSADTVCAVRRARSAMLNRLRPKSSGEIDCRHKADRGVGQVVDLNGTFDKIAVAGIADLNKHGWPCDHKSNGADGTRHEGDASDTRVTTPTAFKHSRVKRHDMGSPLKSELNPDYDCGPIGVSSIPRDGRVGMGSGGVGRGLGSGAKHIVTFADRSHITPVLKGGGSDRSMSGDDSVTQSASTAFDSGFPTQKRARIKSAMSFNSGSMDGNFASPSTFPLSCLVMPGVSANALKSAYCDITSVISADGDDSSKLPKVTSDTPKCSAESDSVTHPRISSCDKYFADLPGALASTLGGLIALIRSLGTVDLSSEPVDTSSDDDAMEASRCSTDSMVLNLRQTLSDAAASILNKVFLGNLAPTSLCCSDDLLGILSNSSNDNNDDCSRGGKVDIEGTPRDCAHSALDAIPILHLFYSFMSSSTSCSHVSRSQRPGSLGDDEDSDLEILERSALGNKRIFRTELEEQQLAAECRLLSTLQELLKEKSDFQRFISDQYSKCDTWKKSESGNGRRRCTAIGRKLINQLCRRLLYYVEEEENENENENGGEPNPSIWIPHSTCRHEFPDNRKSSFSMLKIKISIVRFLSGLVEIHGVDGVAAIFGVRRLPMSLIIRPHDLMKDSSDGDKDRDRVSGGEMMQAVGDFGGTNSNQEESIDSSGVHYIVLCWTLATRTLDQHPSNLSPRGLLLSELVDRTGRLLDGIAGYISPQEWSEVDDEIVNRQMTQRVAKSIHPRIQKQLKENPFYNLW